MSSKEVKIYRKIDRSELVPGDTFIVISVFMQHRMSLHIVDIVTSLICIITLLLAAITESASSKTYLMSY